MTANTQYLHEAAKIADHAVADVEFRRELIRRLQSLDARTTYSGEAGDRIGALGQFLSDAVKHYVVSCGQVMTHEQAVYIGRIKQAPLDATAQAMFREADAIEVIIGQLSTLDGAARKRVVTTTTEFFTDV